MKIALYGINKGLQTLYSLIRDNIYISAICYKKNEYPYSILGKPTVYYDDIKENPYEWKVILAPNANSSVVLEEMKNDGVQAEIYQGNLDTRMYVADLEIDSLSISFFIKENRKRNVYIYGVDDRSIQFYKKMKYLDFNIKAFLTEDDEVPEEIDDNLVLSIFELWISDSNPMIVLAKPTKKIIDLLIDMGIKYGEQFCLMSSLRINERRGNRQAIWDLNLGHSYIDNSSEPIGFIKYGSNKAKRRIVVLGGSTSDSLYTWFPSWPELLWQNLNKAGYNVQILNGAMCGYNVQQELIKLIRDVPDLNPDIVIDFSGTNNVGAARVSPQYPFTPFYLKNISEVFQNHMIKYSEQTQDMKALCQNEKEYSVYLGIATEKSCASSYVLTVRMMNAICREMRYSFVSFFQPNIWTKHKYWDEWEKDIVFCSSVSDLSGDRTDFRLKRAANFIEEVKSIGQDLQVDLTGIFNDINDVYMDTDHYTEKANMIIANTVENYLKVSGLI